MKKNTREIVLVVLGVLFGFWLFITALELICFDNVRFTRIRFFNGAAFTTANAVREHKELLSLPKTGEKWLNGGCSDVSLNSFVYTDSGEMCYLFGSGAEDVSYYWTAKIKDGDVKAVWFAKHPLTESECIPYDWNMQKERIRLRLIPLPSLYVDERAAVGYWSKGDN